MAGYKAAVAMCLLLAVVAALPSSSLGSKDVEEIMEKCEKCILKKSVGLRILDNSDPCCEKVQGVENVKTICVDFTEVQLDLIDLFKWATICKVCGKPLPAGYDCRGYTVPENL
ncbi:hypothetical protein ACP4OV_006889 [Aristida adscensionis]